MSRWTARQQYVEHHAGGCRYGFSFGERARAEWFAAHLGRGRRLLDVGCRDGTLMRHFSVDHRVVGCDIDDRALSICRRGLGVPVVNSDIMQGLPFADQVFEGALLGEVLEHVVDPAFVVSEIHRVLVPGSVFVGSVPNALRLRNRLTFLTGRSFENDPTHLHFYSRSDVERLLQRVGFRELEFAFRESRWLAVSPSLFGNTMLWKSVRA
jgi:SAM-dependent methyltransferase